MADPLVGALLRERAGYVARGLGDRVAQVDALLERLGQRKPVEAAVAPPRENAMQPKPVKNRRSARHG